MKKSLIIGGFCLALLASGCSAPQAAQPQAAPPAAVAQPDDAARRDALIVGMRVNKQEGGHAAPLLGEV